MDQPSPKKAATGATSGDIEQNLEKKLESIASKRRQAQAAALAKKLKLPFSDLAHAPIDPEALILMDEASARAAGCAIVRRSGNELVIVSVDPQTQSAQEAFKELERRGFTLKIAVTAPDVLERVWRHYRTTRKVETFEVGSIAIREEELDALQAQIKNIKDVQERVQKISATKLLEILIAGALKTKASDIHFEPESGQIRLRYRLDGLLNDIAELDPASYQKILNRVKIVSGLKLNVHQSPQDGRFTIQQGKVAIEVRVSVLPSEFGETIVMRLLDPRTIKGKLEDLGMRSDILAQIQEQLKKPTGAIFTTGPTGSGKTTTLYAFVDHLNSRDTKIITIEDPIEYHIEGISQTQVEPAKGYTFANGLRAIVRQDPDVILVGEIRDTETADIALHAALTGHLVFSTLHTNDAAGTIPRLIDLGIKPQTIAPAINCAMAQRLLRKLCEKCKTKDRLDPGRLQKLREVLEPILGKFNLPSLNDELSVYFPGKCDACNGLGYQGRVGVFEIFTITRAMEKLILESPAISDVRDLAIKEGMTTMLQDGYLKLLEGITTIEEIERVLG